MSRNRSSASPPPRGRLLGSAPAFPAGAPWLVRAIGNRGTAALARALIVLTALSLPLAACGHEPKRPAQEATADALKALALRADRMVRADGLSGAMLFASNGRVLFSRAYGLADRERRIPNTVRTRFAIASLQKMFTAVAILQLVEAGEIELTAPLGTYLPDYPDRAVAAKVTVHQLLTHTAGVGDILCGDLLPDVVAHRDELRTLADYVTRYGKRGLEFEPGSRGVYSNYGYIVLGVVIERVTGDSYYDYVRRHVYAPAGMTRTGSPPQNQAAPARAIGYTQLPGPAELERAGEQAAAGRGNRPKLLAAWVPNTDWLLYRGTSADSSYSTVEDLARFARALLGHKLLEPDATELLIAGKARVAPGCTSGGRPRRYAYGFADDRDADGNGWVGHSASSPGTTGDLWIDPKSGNVVARLWNMWTPPL